MKDFTEQLKKYWETESLSFIAIFNRYKTNEGFFNDFINLESLKTLFYPEFDEIRIENKKVSFYIPNSEKLQNGNYYKIDLAYSEKAIKKNNPYSLQIESVYDLDQNDVKNYLLRGGNDDVKKKTILIKSNIDKEKAKEHIQLRFERLNNPEANKIIANLMREIGKGMYSSKQRMIFELLQNADDSPGKEKVEFHIDVNGDYFFIMHDGEPFDKDDIDAITSAAESTKRKDKKKTGYKGIGFKSVFTDSEEVWLKSGGYQFAFIRNSILFNDFDSFYFSSKDYRDFPELIERHRQRYQKDISSYNSLTDIPWQVIPIWQDEIPVEFSDSNFSNFDNPVQFALKVGKNNIYSEDGYLSAIANIVKRPQFLLFLRNTTKFRSPKNRVTILRTDNGEIITIEKSSVEYIGAESIQKKDVLEYIKQIYCNIQVNNEAFSELNIGLKKIIEKNDLNEDTYHFVDLDGNKIETIPPKLASATETEISFGISLVNNKISPEIEYTRGLPKYSSLFTYLPMEDTRFQLPFLVNADFVPSSDRQRIQGDNLWNKYIMIKVAEKHVATLAHFAQEFLEDKETNSSYLSLLLKNPLQEDDSAQQIIYRYNETYQEFLANTEIVINDKNEIQLLSDTIVDESIVVELFGNEIFYDIIETEKRLPHSNLDTRFLKEYKYLNIEVIDLEKLAKQITPEHCESIGNIIAQNSIYQKKELLDWLNRLVKHLPNHFDKIPFIEYNNALFSLENLINEKDAWIINEHTSQYILLIKELGYHTIELNLDKYSNIKEYLRKLSGYLNDKTLTYERIASNLNIYKLPITSKLMLIDFFQNNDFMRGIDATRYFCELELFIDECDNPRPICQLLSRKDGLELNSLNNFRIKDIEYNSLTDDLQKQLITKEKIFTSFILNEDLFKLWAEQFESKNIDTYVTDIKTIYSWIENQDEISSAKWASIPWLYINDELRFKTSDKVYWSKAFNRLSSNKFEIIKSLFQVYEIKKMPVQECGSLMKVFPIKTDDNVGINWSEIDELDLLAANTLLDWMEDDCGFGDFFDNYTLVPNTNGSYKIKVIEDIEIFDGSDIDLKSYILSKNELSSLFDELDKDLCSESRSKIGVLQGDGLTKAIIVSGKYDQNLALHFPYNVSTELFNNFIINLNDFKLYSDTKYDGNSAEHFIISRLLRGVESVNEITQELQNIIEILKSKTLIDGNPLSNYTISDRVSFGSKEDRKVLKLSDILTEYQGESDILDSVRESFSAITQKAKLRDLIFETEPLKYDEIYAKIEAESSNFYSIYQVVFQILDKKYGGNRNWAKQRFDEYLINKGSETELHSFYNQFLEVLIELSFTDISDFTFKDLKLNNCIDKNFAIESECIPNWLEKWINKDQTKRLNFISELGFNGIDSAIVNLRKSMLDVEYDQNLVIKYFEESKQNMQIIWNSILWLAKYNPNIVTQNITIIKQINDYIKFNSDGIKEITIPLIKSINAEGNRLYSLQAVCVGSELFKINIQSDFADSIFSSFNNFNCIDENIGKLSDYLNITTVLLEDSVDLKNLESNSKRWEEPFYLKWELSDDFPIYIYDGNEIPYTRSFRNIIINAFTQDLKVANNNKYYISKVLKRDILNNLPDSFPKSVLSKLKDWHYKTLQNESLLDEDAFDYKENIDRLLQDRLGISEEDQKRESGNAKTHAVYFLDENGYNISNINSAGASLTDIIDPDGNKVNCLVRSAKGGLLYLDKEHWDMMQDEYMYLIVIYPGNSPRLFKNRLELLEEELAENVLFRVLNNHITSEIDGVFNSLTSESHLILVTSEKMKESLFSKLKKKSDFNKDEKVAIGDEDFTF
jgi:hypothetical protein